MTSIEDNRYFKSAPLWAAAAFFLSWYLLCVDGLWGYTQHLIIKKKVLPSSLFVLTLFFFIIKERVRATQKKTLDTLPIILYCWACWMLFVLIIDSQMTFSSPPRIVFGFYVNYWYLFLPALVVNSRFKLDHNFTLYMFLAFAAPIICLGVAQGVMQNSFDIGRWISQEAAAFNLGFFGQRRANAAFAHAEDFGCYSAMALCTCLAMLLQTKKLFAKLILSGAVLVCAIAIYFTLTRVCYLIGFCGIVSTILITQAHKFSENSNKLLYWLPLMFFCLGIAIYFAVPLISLLSKSNSILSSASLADRLWGNRYYLSELQRNSWYSILTGLGWFINGHYRATVALDNQYIALVLSTGVVGLGLWLALTINLWKTLLNHALTSRSPILIGLTATASAWLSQSVFNVNTTFGLVAILGLAINHYQKRTSSDPNPLSPA